MDIKVFTLFPQMFQGPLTTSLLGKAQDKGVFNLDLINFRDYSTDKHKQVDDTPYGGGAGMLLKPEPLIGALKANVDYSDSKHKVLLMTPQGKKFDQQVARELAKEDKLSFVCGHYEGFDERIRYYVHEEYSLGDFVLTGGELAAMVMIDSILRLVPGVIKETISYEEDSFYEGLLEYPQYTRPAIFEDWAVPEVLLSGHHANIQTWQKKEAFRRTLQRRPDLLEKYPFTDEEKVLFEEVLNEEKNLALDS